MDFLLSTLAFVLLLTVLIIVHEIGHYALARFFGVEVEEFGFGIPPRACVLFTKGMTKFTLNWFPFGGFVKLKGENGDESQRSEKGSFASASNGAKLAILSGGVFMNFLLAFIILTIGFWVGRLVPSHYINNELLEDARSRGELAFEQGVFIQEILPHSAAEKAHITHYDRITAVQGQPVRTPEDVLRLQKNEKTVEYTVLDVRTSVSRTVSLTLIDGKAGLSLASNRIIVHHRSFLRALSLAFTEVTFTVRQTILGIGHLVESLSTRFAVPEGITGVVGIAVLTHTSIQDGLMMYVQLVAMLSLSLAILNILPFPALDGGRIVFVCIEMVLRRRLNQKIELLVNAFGFLVLFALILLITFNDVIHLL